MAVLLTQVAKVLIEAAKASTMATHSVAGLCSNVGPLAKEALRLLRCAEALTRSAVAVLQKTPLDVMVDTEVPTPLAKKKRATKKKAKAVVECGSSPLPGEPSAGAPPSAAGPAPGAMKAVDVGEREPALPDRASEPVDGASRPAVPEPGVGAAPSASTSPLGVASSSMEVDSYMEGCESSFPCAAASPVDAGIDEAWQRAEQKGPEAVALLSQFLSLTKGQDEGKGLLGKGNGMKGSHRR